MIFDRNRTIFLVSIGELFELGQLCGERYSQDEGSLDQLSFFEIGKSGTKSKQSYSYNSLTEKHKK
jgi:hypothetical protein